jgi:copper(I)-binding protein
MQSIQYEAEVTMKSLTIIIAAAAALLATAPAPAQHMHDAKGVKVSEPWARAAGKRAHAAVAYLTLENFGDAADKLVSASTPAAGRVELHTHIKDGDVMRMRPVQSIEVGPHAKVTLKPGGLHLMLLDLKGPLEKGVTFPLTLRFEKAGEVTVEVAIQAAGAMGAGHGGHGKGHGH